MKHLENTLIVLIAATFGSLVTLHCMKKPENSIERNRQATVSYLEAANPPLEKTTAKKSFKF